MTEEIRQIVEALGLQPHPEGGYYKEIFRSEEKVDQNALPKRYDGSRHFLTAIHFLITKENASFFHKVNSDEQWYFHQGGTARIHIVDEVGNYEYKDLGGRLNGDESLFANVDRLKWFGVEVIKGDFVLCSCTVAPGFEFADFELANYDEFVKSFPDLKEIADRLC